MIDWWGLAYNAVWILGLGMSLAALSMASYQARVDKVRLRRKLAEGAFQLPLMIGMMLFCLGLLLSSQPWWEKAVWGLASAWFAVQAALVSKRGPMGW